MRVTRKVALITGASSGIGRATAVEFAKHGVKVAIAGRRAEKLEETAQLCYKQGLKEKDVFKFLGDLTKDNNSKEIVDQTLAHFGELDVLINNAGKAPSSTPLLEASVDEFHKMFDIMVEVPFTTTQRALPAIIASKGTIINVSSAAALKQENLGPLYGLAKVTLNHYTKLLAFELGSKQTGATANVICPGVVPTDLHGDLKSDKPVRGDMTAMQWWENIAETHVPNKKLIQPEEMARSILFLASDDARIMNGSVVAADYGYALM